MQAIYMTQEQTEAYDCDDTAVWQEIIYQANRLNSETGETVVVYTSDGILAYVAQDER